MTETTLSEAKRCPFCKQPGLEVGEIPLTRALVKDADVKQGTKLLMVECRNERCSDFEGVRPIQINPDGTIPQPSMDPIKKYPKVQDMTDAYQQRLEAELAAQREGGAELRYR